MKRIIVLAALAGAGIAATGGVSDATAGNRYTPKPPVVLSPDLSEPWLLQLRPAHRVRRAPPRTYSQPRHRDRPRLRRLPHQRVSAVQARPRVQKKRSKRAFNPKYLPTTVAYDTRHKPGTIIIDTNDRFLYLVGSNGEARRYGVGVGRPGFEWAGTHKVTRKAEWPAWRPPAEMRKRQPGLPKYMAGGPRNPLGARAMYLGSTLYRIHGSNEPWSIGRAVSSGCIRMRNEDVIDLYERVKVGTKVVVL